MTLVNISENIWVENYSTSNGGTIASYGGGTKTLTGTLDRVRITSTNGTNTFDSGSVNIFYE